MLALQMPYASCWELPNKRRKFFSKHYCGRRRRRQLLFPGVEESFRGKRRKLEHNKLNAQCSMLLRQTMCSHSDDWPHRVSKIVQQMKFSKLFSFWLNFLCLLLHLHTHTFVSHELITPSWRWERLHVTHCHRQSKISIYTVAKQRRRRHRWQSKLAS